MAAHLWGRGFCPVSLLSSEAGKLHCLFKAPESEPGDGVSFPLHHLILLIPDKLLSTPAPTAFASNLNIQAVGEVH